MTISSAVQEMAMSASSAVSEHRAFRARQLILDTLVGEVEQAVMSNLASAPAGLFKRARRAIASVHGRVPTWLAPNISPVSLLNHLLVAEGMLRRRYYRGVRLDLRESG